jgi:hypothetical protein
MIDVKMIDTACTLINAHLAYWIFFVHEMWNQTDHAEGTRIYMTCCCIRIFLANLIRKYFKFEQRRAGLYT